MSSHRSFVHRTCMILLLIAGLPASGSALPVTIDLTAVVATVSDSDGFLGGAITPGSVVHGTYRYESTAVDSNNLPEVGDYWYNAPSCGLWLEVGGLHFGSDPSDTQFLLEICNNHSNHDAYLLRSYNNLFDVSVPRENEYDTIDNHLSWQLDDPTMQAVSSTDPPLGPPFLGDWESNYGLQIMSYNYSTGGFFQVTAHVSDARLVPSPVPEPGTAAMLLFGVTAVSAWAARKRREPRK